jgi:hypothetical protein
MALDDTAASAVAAAYAEAVLTDAHATHPDFDDAKEQAWRAENYETFIRRQKLLIKAIFDGIAAHAEVTPNGSPAFEAGGDAVTGKGKVT